MQSLGNLKKHKIVALSTFEAEFMATAITTCQAIWLANLVKELIGYHIMPIIVYVNNKLAITLMKKIMCSMIEGNTLKFIFISYDNVLNVGKL